MKITSIISEYNPFHEGHNYHLKEAKKITDSDYVIVIMSGNFTQRGTPAIADKFVRTKQALLCGADLVLELPVCFATASAEGFACGAISILEGLGVTDSLVFGSESGDISLLQKTADFLSEEPAAYKTKLKTYLKQGLSFPKARAKCLSETAPDITEGFLSTSNNILGIEYCKALKFFQSSITPVTIRRKDNLYHDEQLSSYGKLSSATAIRKILLNETKENLSDEEIFKRLSSHLPESSLTILQENWNLSAPVSANDFSSLLKYKLLLESNKTLTRYTDVTSDLAERIYNRLNDFTDFESFCNLLKTKELTYTRISRCLLHILLDLRKKEHFSFQNHNIFSENTYAYGQYARILGFRKSAAPLLHEIKTHASIPMISKLSESGKILSPSALSLLQKDIQSAHIYESIISNKFKQKFRNEYQRQIIIL